MFRNQARFLANQKAKEYSSEALVFPQKIRVSLGSAIILGLLEGKLDAEPTTAYLMTYKSGKCTANCGFCPQARSSQSRTEMLSRVTWPVFPTSNVLERLAHEIGRVKLKRVCVQALNYPEVFCEVSSLVKKLKQNVSVQVSVSCQPLVSDNLWLLSKAGVDRVGIALDAATRRLFSAVKGANTGGPYDWENQFKLLRAAIGVFGEGSVSTHLIVGLGETEIEAASLIQKCVDMGVLPALFAFTPIEGTALAACPPPKVGVYRRVQLARYLIVNGLARIEDISHDADGRITDFGISKTSLVTIVESGEPFLTSGCADCNRPFYNEKPSGPIYNYPRPIRQNEIAKIKQQLEV